MILKGCWRTLNFTNWEWVCKKGTQCAAINFGTIITNRKRAKRRASNVYTARKHNNRIVWILYTIYMKKYCRRRKNTFASIRLYFVVRYRMSEDYSRSFSWQKCSGFCIILHASKLDTLSKWALIITCAVFVVIFLASCCLSTAHMLIQTSSNLKLNEIWLNTRWSKSEDQCLRIHATKMIWKLWNRHYWL